MSLRFLGIILVLRLDVSVYNVYMTNPFQTTFVEAGGGGVKSIVEVTVNSKEEIFQDYNYIQEFGLWYGMKLCIPTFQIFIFPE
jgi:hypothetical protein